MTDNLYQLLDCGNSKKLEKFGNFTLIRPAAQAIWQPKKLELWENADSEFIVEKGEKGKWKALKNPEGIKRKKLGNGFDEFWDIQSKDGMNWTIVPNEFGNVGVFTEHWTYVEELSRQFNPKAQILNIFTYAGSNAVYLAKKGFKITAVDSSKVAISNYVNNLEKNKINREGHKLVCEDANKFMQRESRRGAKYKSIMVDAPSFGRGTKGEVFDIESDFAKLILNVKNVLDKDGKLVLTLHSPRYTPKVLENFLQDYFPGKTVSVQEILNPCEYNFALPSGFIAKVGF